MLTAFDVGVAVLVLISAILATARGFTREVLSLATWAGSAAIAVYMYVAHKDIARGYIDQELVADAVTVGGTFLVSLIVLHLITMWIADMVVDSKVGPLDRTLGFLFGVARGILLGVVGALFMVWLIPAPMPPWAAESRTLPILQNMGQTLINLLPDDAEQWLNDLIKEGTGQGEELPGPEEAPAGEDATPPTDASSSSEPATNT
ncbi:MAG: CvpA family protein [Devosia sp.]